MQRYLVCMDISLMAHNGKRCTRIVRVDFSRAKMRSSDSARMNKSNVTNEKIV